jgi:predicted P-loop ATPase
MLRLRFVAHPDFRDAGARHQAEKIFGVCEMKEHSPKTFLRPETTYTTWEDGKEVTHTIPAKPRGKVASIKAATRRAPVNGWDSVIDRDAVRDHFHKSGLAFELTGDEATNKDRLRRNLTQCHLYGIHPKTAAQFVIGFWADGIAAGKITKQEIVDAAKHFYAESKLRPGSLSKAGKVAAAPDRFSDNQHGKPNASDPKNIGVALNKLGIKLWFDSFQCKTMIEGLEGFGPVLQDEHVNRLRFLIHENYEFLPDEYLLYKFVLDRARRNATNPARDYFDSLEWDGVKRLDSFLIDYAGATDTPYVRAVGCLPFIAAIRRVRHPGTKFDEMLVCESSQGKNKSSAFELMATRKEWFTDSVPLNAHGREVVEAVEGKLFVEVAELQGMRKGDIEHVKAMLSRRVDRARAAYGRIQVERPRQFVFIGTSNGRSYLRDDTGNRRFWPVAIKQFDLEALARDRDQLWAEAAWREDMAESIRLTPALYPAAGREQAKRLEITADPFTDAFRDYLGDRAGKITAQDAWLILGIDDVGRRTPELQRRFGMALRAAGWRQRTLKIQGASVRGFTRGQATQEHQHRHIVVTLGYDRRPIVEYADEQRTPGDEFEDESQG